MSFDLYTLEAIEAFDTQLIRFAQVVATNNTFVSHMAGTTLSAYERRGRGLH